MTSNNPIDIYIIGTGMVGYRQMTVEAQRAVQNSETVYLVHYQKVVAEYLEEEVGTELDVDTDDVVLLTEEYEEEVERADTYERMAESVLEGATNAENPVTFALYGHPNVFVSPTSAIVKEAENRDLEVEVRPGVSSMDCLYSDLNLDPAENGIQMFEATDLLLREFELNPDVPAFIWQVGSLETTLYAPSASSPERFDRITEYLERFYPEDHEVYLCQTATYPFTESKQIEFELDDFDQIADQVNGVQTLYIPPVRVRDTQNEELYEQVRSAEHLETITQ